MPKSKYPSQLDTSAEIPAVRDNIVEIGSDVLNSIRTAIFQIERTLGVNPQGAVGNTVAGRLNKISDGNGNILKEALDKSGLISGPIIDSDVSKVAAIQESKLRLNYPTQVLQSEISILNSQIDEIIEKIAEIAAQLSAHINQYALDRHPALSISLSEYIGSPSSTATMSVVAGTLEDGFNDLYDSHINYDGSDIAVDNRSHTSNQIFFDNSYVSSYISSDNLQETVEELTLLIPEQVIEHQDLFHSNGILRTGEVLGEENGEYGLEIVSDVSTSFSELGVSSIKTTEINFGEKQDSGLDIDVSDTIVISISDEDEEFEVSSVIYSSDGGISGVNIFGLLDGGSTSAYASLYKNKKSSYIPFALAVGMRERADKTSCQVLQVANPDSPAVISDHANPMEITVSNRYFVISINGGSDNIIDTFSGDSLRQTIDSVISSINEQAAEKSLMFLAYRVDVDEHRSEIALVNNVPGNIDDTISIKISEHSGTTLEVLGFGEYIDKEIYTSFGSQYYIEGISHSGLKTITSFSPVYYSGNKTIYSSSAIDFVAIGVRIGSIINLFGGSEEGSYHITSVTEDRVTLDSGQLPTGFSSDSSDDVVGYIYENTVSLDAVVFDEVDDSYGAMLLDVFMSSDLGVYFTKRLSYEAGLVGEDSVFTVVDFYGDVSGKSFDLEFKYESDTVSIRVDYGEYVDIIGIDNYIYLNCGNYNISFKIYVPNIDDIITKILVDGDADSVIHGFSGVNEDTNLTLARINYSNFKGRASGGSYNYPRAFSSLQSGNVGISDISTQAKNILLERPIDELRSNGVIIGCSILSASINSDDLYEVEIERGVVYVKGKRFEIFYQEIITDLSGSAVDKFYIAVDEYGNIVFDPADGYCMSGIVDGEYCLLGSVENSSGVVSSFDLRLLVSDLDLKVLNSITVSPQAGMGHFTELGPAIQYAKRFSEIFPNAGAPTIHLKSGLHRTVIEMGMDSTSVDNTADKRMDSSIEAGLLIDFQVNVVGEGDTSIISILHNYDDLSVDDPDSSNYVRGMLPVFGHGVTADLYSGISNSYETISHGKVLFSNLCFLNCKLGIREPVQVDILFLGSLTYCKFEIDRVTFDYREITFGEHSNALSAYNRDDNMFVGNISVTNCNFKNTYIWLDSSCLNWHDITLINNRITCTGAPSWWLDSDTGSIALPSMPCANNVHIRANVPALATDGAFMDRDQEVPWTDVVSRDMYICGDLNLGGGLDVGGLITGMIKIGEVDGEPMFIDGDGVFVGSDEVAAPMYKKRSYFFDQRGLPVVGFTNGAPDGPLLTCNMWNAGVSGVGYGYAFEVGYGLEEIKTTHLDLPGPATTYVRANWPYAYVQDMQFYPDPSACMLPILIDLPKGESMTQVVLYRDRFDPDDVLFGDTIEITLEIWRFTSGPSSTSLYSGPLVRIGTFVDTFVDTSVISAGASWERVEFNIDPEITNTYTGSSHHDKYFLQVGVTFPNNGGVSGLGIKFYKAHVVTKVDSLIEALGLGTQSDMET